MTADPVPAVLSNVHGSWITCFAAADPIVAVVSLSVGSLGDVKVLRVQVPVRRNDVSGRDQQVGERARDADRVQD